MTRASRQDRARMTVLVGFAAVCCLLGFSTGTRAQESGDSPPPDLVFGEEIDVRVVNLEVVVEDRAGNRVSGLGPEDFRVFVNDEEVAVEYFTEILENRALSTDGDAPPAVGDGELVPTNYLLFIDDDHTQVTRRRGVLRRFVEQLPTLAISDQVAVVVQSRRQLTLLSPFTTDRQRTRETVELVERQSGFGGVLASPQRRERQALALAGSGGNLFPGAPVAEDLTSAAADLRIPGMLLPGTAAEARNDALARDLEFSVAAVSSAMRALDPPVGRKVLMLLAGRWPMGHFRPTGKDIGMVDGNVLLRPLIDTANVLGYTIYPLDEQGPPNQRRFQNLRLMAAATGGRAYMAGSNMQALRRVTEDTSNYYWLGVVPRYERDDRARSVRVEVRDPRLGVRSRDGYVDQSRRAESDLEAIGLLLFPDQVERAVEPTLSVDLGRPTRAGLRKMSLPLTVHLPVGRFATIPFEDRFLSRLELRFAVVDSNGQQAAIPLIPISLEGASEPAPETTVPYETTLTLRRRPHVLLVSVHDPLSDRTLSNRLTISF